MSSWKTVNTRVVQISHPWLTASRPIKALVGGILRLVVQPAKNRQILQWAKRVRTRKLKMLNVNERFKKRPVMWKRNLVSHLIKRYLSPSVLARAWLRCLHVKLPSQRVISTVWPSFPHYRCPRPPAHPPGPLGPLGPLLAIVVRRRREWPVKAHDSLQSSSV